VSIRLFNANVPVITWGFLAFVGSLVVMQGRYFTSLFSQVVESGKATEEARLRLVACFELHSGTIKNQELHRTYSGFCRFIGC